MKFGGHVAGGLITAAGVSAASAVYTGSSAGSPDLLASAKVFIVALFFSLFPDLDVSSIPQRWFFRVIFLLLLVLGYYGEFELATIIAVLALTPLLDHHHGWTHNFYSPLLVPLFLIIIYDMILLKNILSVELFWERLMFFTDNYFWIFIAASLGWYTHIFLDMPLPFLRNSRNHF